jgi:hypothetical protein
MPGRLRKLKASPAAFRDVMKNFAKALKNPKAAIKGLRTLRYRKAIGNVLGGGKFKDVFKLFKGKGAGLNPQGVFGMGRMLTGAGGLNKQHGKADDFGNAFNSKITAGKTLQHAETAWKSGRRVKRVIHHAGRGVRRARAAFKGVKNVAGAIKTMKKSMEALRAVIGNPAQVAMRLAAMLGKKILGKMAELKRYLGELGDKIVKGVFNTAAALMLILPNLASGGAGNNAGSGGIGGGSGTKDGSTPVTPWGFVIAAAVMAISLAAVAVASAGLTSDVMDGMSEAEQRKMQREGDLAEVVDAFMRAFITADLCGETVGGITICCADFPSEKLSEVDAALNLPVWVGKCNINRPDRGVGFLCPYFNITWADVDGNIHEEPDCEECNNIEDSNGNIIVHGVQTIICQIQELLDEAESKDTAYIPASSHPAHILRRAHQVDPALLAGISKRNLLEVLLLDHPEEACLSDDRVPEGETEADSDKEWEQAPEGPPIESENCDDKAFHVVKTDRARMRWIRQRGREIQRDRKSIEDGATAVLGAVEEIMSGRMFGEIHPSLAGVAEVVGVNVHQRESAPLLHALDVVNVAAYFNHDDDGYPMWDGRGRREGVQILFWRVGQRDAIGLDWYIERLFTFGIEERHDHGMYAGNLVSMNQTFVGVRVQHDHISCPPCPGHGPANNRTFCGRFCSDCHMATAHLHSCIRKAIAQLHDNVVVRPLHDANPFHMMQLSIPIVAHEVRRVQFYLNAGSGKGLVADGCTPQHNSINGPCHNIYIEGTYTDAQSRNQGRQDHPHRAGGYQVYTDGRPNPGYNTIEIAKNGRTFTTEQTCPLTALNRQNGQNNPYGVRRHPLIAVPSNQSRHLVNLPTPGCPDQPGDLRVSLYDISFNKVLNRYQYVPGKDADGNDNDLIIEHEEPDRQTTTVRHTWYGGATGWQIHFGLDGPDPKTARRLYGQETASHTDQNNWRQNSKWYVDIQGIQMLDTRSIRGQWEAVNERTGWYRIFEYYEQRYRRLAPFGIAGGNNRTGHSAPPPPVLWQGYENVLYLALPFMRVYYPAFIDVHGRTFLDNDGGSSTTDTGTANATEIDPIDPDEEGTGDYTENNPILASDLLLHIFPYTFYNRGIYIPGTIIPRVDSMSNSTSSPAISGDNQLFPYRRRNHPHGRPPSAKSSSERRPDPGRFMNRTFADIWTHIGRKDSDHEVFRSEFQNEKFLDKDDYEKVIYDGYMENDILTALRDREELFKIHFPLIDRPHYFLDFSVAVTNWSGGGGGGTWTGPLQRGIPLSEVPSVEDLAEEFGLSPGVIATLNRAAGELGKPYVWGGGGPNNYDCSGFSSYATTGQTGRQRGTANAQWLATNNSQVTLENARPGDLVFWFGIHSDTGQFGATHVAIFWGWGNDGTPIIIHASSSAGCVELRSLYSGFTITRPPDSYYNP